MPFVQLQSRRFRPLVAATALVLLLCSLSVYGATLAPSATSEHTVSIDISNLTPFLNSLPPDERDEQLRDWAVYGLKKAVSAGKQGELPVRHPALAAERPGEVSSGRVFAISAKEWGIVAPPELLIDKPRLGGLIDRRYSGSGKLPERVSLFSYRFDPSTAEVVVDSAGVVDARDFYTPDYGYCSATVASPSELAGFLGRIDDLVSFAWRSGRLTLGGRKYVQHDRRALTVQDVAALYQAYNPPRIDAKTLEKAVRERYAELLRTDAGLRKALDSGKVKKSKVMARLRRQMSPRNGGQVGFSLDPEYDYQGIAGDILRMTGGHAAGLHTMEPSLAELFSIHRDELNAAALGLVRRHNLGPLLELRRRYENSRKPEDRRLSDILKNMVSVHAYQTARYDGALQGTSAGMILFYTDLLAKLWALDYRGMAPKSSVKGFRTMREIAVPKLYWDDYVRLSKTRLWFGLRSEGFDLYGDKLLFQPAVTRVYAASSDPLFPGRESKPNYPSATFLGWWDRHYEAVAAVEPYYHRLDQIQKWSCAIMVLKEKRAPALDFLRGVPVRRDLDFETWSRTEPVLSEVGLTFLDRTTLGRSTECLPLLISNPYPLMGTQYVLSGGVSLASRSDVLAKLHRQGRRVAAAVPADADTGLDDSSPPSHGVGKSSASARTSRGNPVLLPGGKAASEAVQAGKGRKSARGGAASQQELPAADEAPVRDQGRVATAGSGSVKVAKRSEKIKLTWEKGPSVAVHDLVNSLAALQQEGKPRLQGEAIFGGVGELRKVIRVRQWGAYLVKTEAGKDQWMYLEINPAKVEGFPARAAAALPEADIFCAKLVSDSYARRLAEGKTAIR